MCERPSFLGICAVSSVHGESRQSQGAIARTMRTKGTWSLARSLAPYTCRVQTRGTTHSSTTSRTSYLEWRTLSCHSGQ